MKTKVLLPFLLLIGLKVYAQDQQWGVGLRFGDPLGITAKKYLPDNKALELSFGRAGWGWDRSGFEDCGKETHYNDYNRISISRISSIGLTANYLFQNDVKELDGLIWYFGFGAQIRISTFKCSYRYKLEGDSEWRYNDKKSADFDIGGNGVIGLEYNFAGYNYPISIFVDAILFMEIVDNPFNFIPQGGIGARYNF